MFFSMIVKIFFGVVAQDFEEKSRRGDGMGKGKPRSFFDRIEEQATQNCTDDVGLGPYVRRFLRRTLRRK